MKLENQWPKYYKRNVITHYCPGCGHGIVHRIVAEVLEELDVGGRSLLVCPAGCAVLAYHYLDIDVIESAHGRGTAIATGVSRANPDLFVISYQGDGDLASIGLAEIMQATQMGLPLTFLFINNAVYGMTGGQMAPTTLTGMRTTTTPTGRERMTGLPLRMAETVAQMDGPIYVERCALYDNK
jgi:pyruvate/2-oxoacid:ferredoxin oxidoreductase beta subunit